MRLYDETILGVETAAASETTLGVETGTLGVETAAVGETMLRVETCEMVNPFEKMSACGARRS